MLIIGLEVIPNAVNMDESSCALWLQEVESVDYWGPTFRAIYEGGAQEEFLQRLEKRIEELETKEYERDLNERPKN